MSHLIFEIPSEMKLSSSKNRLIDQSKVNMGPQSVRRTNAHRLSILGEGVTFMRSSNEKMCGNIIVSNGYQTPFYSGLQRTSLVTLAGRRIASLILVGCVISLCGCGESGPTIVPVSGSVSYKGSPLTNGIVRFNPVDPKTGRPAEGNIGSDGKFTLSTIKSSDGAIAGEYNVTVISYKVDSNVPEKDRGLQIGGESAIPEKYSDPLKSGLKEKIEAGNPRNDVKLELTD
ncbi:MAG: hypothetical protein ACKVT0_01155 [Planctomycetaceae bacterium]